MLLSAIFVELETDGKPVCHRCVHGEAYTITSRRKFKCKSCHHQFSVTSGNDLRQPPTGLP